MELNLTKVRREVRAMHKANDLVKAKELFVQAASVQKQLLRFKRLHQICASMLDHVKEQSVMSTTSSVLQEFVSVHEELIKECNLEKLVSQYQELQGNVDEMRNDMNYVGDALSASPESEGVDWDKELQAFLNEDQAEFVPQQLMAPAAVEAERVGEVQMVPLPAVPRMPVLSSDEKLHALFNEKQKEGVKERLLDAMQ
jgi:hypothetical protein